MLDYIKLDNPYLKYQKYPHDYILIYSGINDYGYMTDFDFYKSRIHEDNCYICKLNIIRPDLHRGELVSSLHDCIGYIESKDWALRLLLMLTLNEREEFIKTFNIHFSPIDSDSFKSSVLRGTTLDKWIKAQQEIEQIVSFKYDVHSQFELLKELNY